MSDPVSNGCSGGLTWAWRTFLRRDPPWEGCCDAHDAAYTRGGTKRDRWRADNDLCVCVVESGHPIWATAIYFAVRLFGSDYFPLKPRRLKWGHGRKKK